MRAWDDPWSSETFYSREEPVSALRNEQKRIAQIPVPPAKSTPSLTSSRSGTNESDVTAKAETPRDRNALGTDTPSPSPQNSTVPSQNAFPASNGNQKSDPEDADQRSAARSIDPDPERTSTPIPRAPGFPVSRSFNRRVFSVGPPPASRCLSPIKEETSIDARMLEPMRLVSPLAATCDTTSSRLNASLSLLVPTGASSPDETPRDEAHSTNTGTGFGTTSADTVDKSKGDTSERGQKKRDEEDQRKPKRPKASGGQSVPQRLRCPFYSSDPQKHELNQACSSGLGFPDMAKLM